MHCHLHLVLNWCALEKSCVGSLQHATRMRAAEFCVVSVHEKGCQRAVLHSSFVSKDSLAQAASSEISSRGISVGSRLSPHFFPLKIPTRGPPPSSHKAHRKASILTSRSTHPLPLPFRRSKAQSSHVNRDKAIQSYRRSCSIQTHIL